MNMPPNPDALRAWADNGPTIPEPAPERKVYTHCGVWTRHGFLEMLPTTFIEYELPELSPDEQIEAARRYVRKMYGDDGP
jgi:hypothetical protein